MSQRTKAARKEVEGLSEKEEEGVKTSSDLTPKRRLVDDDDDEARGQKHIIHVISCNR